MRTSTLRSDSLLLLTSLVWGLAFVAQREGMKDVGPFLFNGIRFALGALVIIPFIYYSRRRHPSGPAPAAGTSYLLKGGILLGLVLFGGASLQQYGLVFTNAGNAGFITGLYVVIVPLLGLFRKQYPHFTVWIAVALAAFGMYFLSIREGFTISAGDLLVLIGAFFWAVHVLVIDVLAPKVDALKLAFLQYAVCTVLSIMVALFAETIALDSILKAAVPILYGGVVSVGIAYTLQVIAQKNAPPAHAAVILSLEAVFAALGGWLILHEQLGMRELLGCGLMLLGMLVAQYCTLSRRKCTSPAP